jgi:hypothetical protein
MSHAFPPINPLARPGENDIIVSRKAIVFGDEDVAVTVGTFPAGTIILDVKVNVTTAFNDGTASTVDIGVDGNPDAFVDNGDLSAAGVISMTLVPAGLYLAAADVVVALVLGTDGDATAGAGEVVITWLATDTA